MKAVSEEYFTKDDILKSKELRGAGIPSQKKYDPKVFWDDLGELYFKRFTDQKHLQVNVGWIIDRLKLLGCKTVLDVGCGFGRVLPFILDPKAETGVKNCTGVDISEPILKCWEKYLEPPEKSNGVPDFRKQISFKVGDVRKLEFDSESFDCALACEVLQHVSSEEIYDACRELLRVSKRAVVCIERWSFPSEHSEPHIWSHDLAQIFQSLGSTVLQVTTVAPGMQGVVILKRGA